MIGITGLFVFVLVFGLCIVLPADVLAETFLRNRRKAVCGPDSQALVFEELYWNTQGEFQATPMSWREFVTFLTGLCEEAKSRKLTGGLVDEVNADRDNFLDQLDPDPEK
jgi:hypothetical protein